MSDQIHLCDGLTLDLARGCLLRAGRPVHLRPQSYEVLRYLAEQRGRLVSKDRLIEEVWHGRAVTDGSLGKCIEEVRGALGADGSRCIRTVRGRGYIFDPDAGGGEGGGATAAQTEQVELVKVVVEEVETGGAEGVGQAVILAGARTAGGGVARRMSRAKRLVNVVKRHKLPALVALAALAFGGVGFVYFTRPDPREQPIRSLAVLPLKSLDAGDNYLGVGLADTIITKVSQLGDLIVRPTSAVRKYAGQDVDPLEAARQLQADAVLDGTMQRAGDRLRVSVNLLRTSDGASLWAETFDLNFTDIFAIQDDVARQVAARLQRRLAPEQQRRLGKRYTASADAYEFYLKGNYHLDKVGVVRTPDLDVAVEMYKKAVEIDPQYALAYARLAYCYTRMALFTDVENPVWIERAREELRRAESLDPELVELSEVRFQILYSKYSGYDMVGAYREVQRARRIDPNFGHAELGVIYDHSGLEDAALKELRRVMEVDPTSEFGKRRLAEAYELLVRPDDSIATSQMYFNEPGGLLSLLWKGRLDEAEAQIEKSLPGHPEDVRTRSAQVRLRALQGRFREAEALIPAIEEKARETRSYHHVTYDFACAYALEGRAAEAVGWLRRTVDYGMPSYTLFERDPHLDRIRQMPEFIQFMAGMRTRWEGYRREFGEGTR